MSQLWIRKYSLTISVSGGLLDISELQCKFTTTAVSVGTPYRTLQCRIYNPRSETIQAIINEGKTQITLAAGYEGQYGAIFTGDIVQCRRGREDAVTTYLDISATDGDIIYNESFLNTTLSSGSNFKDRVSAIGKAGGFTVNQIVATTNDQKKLPRGRVYFGMSRDHLRQAAASIGATYVITDNQVQILAQDATIPGMVPEISAKTGMIGMPQQILDGLQIKTLLNPNLARGKPVHVTSIGIQLYQNDLSIQGNKTNAQLVQLNISGYYKIVWCTHKGDTRGTGQDDWSTEMVVTITGKNMTASGGLEKYTDRPMRF